jgi:TolB-like protein
MSSPPGSQLPGTAPPSIPDFELLGQIGRGSYGDVWLARSVTGIFRAIKIVWRDRFADVEPFEREFRGLKEFAAISLGESTQMALLHVGRNVAAGYFYYVMELADDAERGRAIDPANYAPLTLAEVQRRGRLPAAECVRFGVELARSLAGLHRRGLVHRDIKPSNIILVNDTPKLADIGLVAPASSARTFVGTEGYVPPEGPGSPGADVFALGKVLYELATGLDRQTFPKLPDDLRAQPDWRALLALNEVILRACEPQPEKRYRHAATLLIDLKRLQAGRPVRRVARWQVGATAAILAVGAIGFAVWNHTSAPTVVSTPPSPEVPPNSIAVLPFTNMSGDKANADFADGVHEEVLTSLTTVGALKVISGASMTGYRDNKKPVSQIGRELSVAHVLRGSVRREGNHVQVTCQLIKAATAQHLWANTYNKELRDIFAVQADIARQITTALQLALSAAERHQLEAIPTRDSAAYVLLKEAKGIESRSVSVDDRRDRVLPLVLRAVELDPNYAEAWAELAEIHADLHGALDPSEKRLNLARAALEKAKVLAPDSYATLSAEVRVAGVTRKPDVVKALRRRIIVLFPGRAEAHKALAEIALADRRWEDALASCGAAKQLDPRNPAVLGIYFRTLRQARRYDEAESVGRLCLDVEPEDLVLRLEVAQIPAIRNGSLDQLEKLHQEIFAKKAIEPNVGWVRARLALSLGRYRDFVDIWLSDPEEFRWHPAYKGYHDLNLIMVAGNMRALGEESLARPLLERLHASMSRHLDKDPKNVSAMNTRGLAEAMLGDHSKGAATLASARELMAENPQNFIGRRWENAAYRTWAGESSEAIAAFAELLRQPLEGVNWGHVHLMRSLWLLTPLHGHPDFEKLLRDPANNAVLF